MASQSLRVSRCHFGLVNTGKYLYALGGYPYMAFVERAEIMADGSLGEFEIDPGSSLPVPLGMFSTARVGKTVFVLGGEVEGSGGSGFTRQKNVYAATIDDAGKLGTFRTFNFTLTKPRTRATVAVFPSTLYLIGGGGDDIETMTYLERTTIDPSGTTIGSFGFRSSSTKLNVPTVGSSLFMSPSHLYLLGGYQESGPMLDYVFRGDRM